MNKGLKDLDIQVGHICDLPPAVDGNSATIMPPACPPDPLPPAVTEAPIAPPCPEPVPLPRPFFIEECKPCNMDAVRIKSIPPELGCPPLISGWGAYDGGFKEWYGLAEQQCGVQLSTDAATPFFPNNWGSILDLNTAPLHGTSLVVRGDGSPRLINEAEFRNLAVKLGMLAVMAGIVAAPTAVQNPSGVGLKVVEDGEGGTGLFSTYNDVPIGTPLPLVVAKDAEGLVVGYLIKK